MIAREILLVPQDNIMGLNNIMINFESWFWLSTYLSLTHWLCHMSWILSKLLGMIEVYVNGPLISINVLYIKKLRARVCVGGGGGWGEY